MAFAERVTAPMTVAEFFEWDGDGEPYRHQLIDGVPVAMTRPRPNHGRIAANLASALISSLRSIDSPCGVFMTPGVVPHIRSTTNLRVPDIAVSCSDRGDTADLHEPVMIAEVLSPSNRAETWEAIRNYLTIPSVQTILIVESVHAGISVLQRDAAGAWPREPAPVPLDGEIALEALGVTLMSADVYRGVPLT